MGTGGGARAGTEPSVDLPSAAEPVVPDYAGACIANVSPALLRRAERPLPAWIPGLVGGADHVVLLVLDGLGWNQLTARPHLAPTLAAMAGGPITSVAPTTTAVALTSIATGLPPAAHGLPGYRVRVPAPAAEGQEQGPGEVLNVLRWRTPSGDAMRTAPPDSFGVPAPFLGDAVPAVTFGSFRGTGFTDLHLKGARLVGWRQPSSIPVLVGSLVAAGDPFVYAYYDGIDKVAHEHGLGEHYDAELRYADRLVGDLLAVLPADAALVVTSDHGQVHVGRDVVAPEAGLLADVVLMSGEGRFRWLHLAPGADPDATAARFREAYGDIAWVHTRRELIELGWYGGALRPEAEALLGDVALVPFTPTAFVDPADSGELALVSRHGSLTPDEVFVPLLAAGGAG